MSKNILFAPSIAAILLTGGVSSYFAYQYTSDVKADRFYSAAASSLQSASLNTITLAMRAASDATYAGQLEAVASEANSALGRLLKGNIEAGISPLGGNAVPALDRYESAWSEIEQGVNAILASRSNNTAFERQSADSIKLANSLLTEATDSVNAIIDNDRVDPRVKTALETALDNLAAGIDSLANLPYATSESLESAQDASRAFVASLAAIGGALPREKQLVDPLHTSYKTAQTLARSASRSIELASGAVDNAPNIRKIWAQREALETSLKSLNTAIITNSESRLVSPMMLVASVLLSLIVVLGSIVLILRQTRENTQRATALANNIQSTQKGRSEELHILIDEMKTLSSGDLSVEFTDRYESTREIASTLNEVFPKFRSIVREVQQTIASLSAASEQTLSMARNTERSRNEQVQAIMHIAKLIDELNSFTRELDRIIRSTQDSSRDVSNQIKQSSHAVNEVHQGVTKLRASNDTITHQAKAMVENVQALQGIIEVVRRISSQASTISFNAKIISETITDEKIRNRLRLSAEAMNDLTKEANQAATSITTSVNAISVAAMDTQYVVNTNHQDMASLKAKTDQALNAMALIRETTNELVEGIVSVAGKAEDLHKRSGQVAETMEQIHHYASDHSAASEQTATAIGNLNTQAQRVGETLSQFKS